MTMARQAAELLREVEVMGIPSGFHVALPVGTPVIIQQRLGGAWTAMTPTGGLVRIDGKDADALGPEFVEEAKRYDAERAAAAEGPFDQEKVWDALRQVYDPEIPSNIVELGLVYGVGAEPVEGGHKVKIVMTLTAPACGIGPVIVDDVRRRVLGVPGVKEADVEIVFDPPWEPSRMSEAARLQLGFM
jgi:probable FeS assembly SUF system protein SufT